MKAEAERLASSFSLRRMPAFLAAFIRKPATLEPSLAAASSFLAIFGGMVFPLIVRTFSLRRDQKFATLMAFRLEANSGIDR